MVAAVNFLPWRRRRRRQCLRLWGLCYVSSVLCITFVFFCLRVGVSTTNATQNLRYQADTALANALDQRLVQWKAQQLAQAQRLARQKQRELTQRWQQVLSDMAADLPEQAWFTQLSVQQQVMTVMGRANTFAALKAVDSALQGLSGFQTGTPGKTGRDEQGYWQFSYQLVQETGNDAQP